MHDTIENRVGERGIAEVFVPPVGGQLTRDDGGPVAVPIGEDLQEILALRVFEPDEAPIIQDEDVDTCETRRHRRICAVTVGERELGKDAWDAREPTR